MDSEKKENLIVFDEFGRAIWECDYTGIVGGRYTGVFIFKPILSAIEEIAVDRLYRKLIGNENVELITPTIEKLAYALASLKYRIIKAPPFWTDRNSYSKLIDYEPSTEILSVPGGHIDDIDLIFEVYAASVEAQLQFRDKLIAKKKENEEIIKKHFEKIKEEKAKEDSQNANEIKEFMEKDKIELPKQKEKVFNIDEEEE